MVVLDTYGTNTDPVVFVFLLLAELVIGAWLMGGLVGFVMLLAKGKMGFGSVGCLLWILFGWWVVPLLICLGGGILLLIGIYAKADVACPHCREKIKWDARRCPFCQSEIPAPQPASA